MAPLNSKMSQSITTIDKSNHTCTETLITTTRVCSSSPNSISNNNIANVVSMANNNVNSSIVSEEQATQSTIFTTTALIETHASNEAGKPIISFIFYTEYMNVLILGICTDFDSDDSSSSNEILL